MTFLSVTWANVVSPSRIIVGQGTLRRFNPSENGRIGRCDATMGVDFVSAERPGQKWVLHRIDK
jgi:hypothetical protein